MTIRTSQLGGGGSGFKLAPDLTWPVDKFNDSRPQRRITGINASAGLTTAVSLTGKWFVSALAFNNLTTENVTYKLTVDGVVIWNATRTETTTSSTLLGANVSGTGAVSEGAIICNSSLLLEVQTTTDTSIDLIYQARPIV